MIKRIMIDCETMSLSDTPAIVQIAAVEFGNHGHYFNTYIDPKAAEQYGHVDRETMEWWNAPERVEVRKGVFSGKEHPTKAIRNFLDWCGAICRGEWEDLRIYSKGGEDSLWLKNLCERCGYHWLPHYRAPQNMRTLQDVAELCDLRLRDIPKTANHDALEDCLWQVKVCEQIMNTLQTEIDFAYSCSPEQE